MNMNWCQRKVDQINEKLLFWSVEKDQRNDWIFEKVVYYRKRLLSLKRRIARHRDKQASNGGKMTPERKRENSE